MTTLIHILAIYGAFTLTLTVLTIGTLCWILGRPKEPQAEPYEAEQSDL